MYYLFKVTLFIKISSFPNEKIIYEFHFHKIQTFYFQKIENPLLLTLSLLNFLSPVYGGCGRISNPKFIIYFLTVTAICGRELSCKNKTLWRFTRLGCFCWSALCRGGARVLELLCKRIPGRSHAWLSWHYALFAVNEWRTVCILSSVNVPCVMTHTWRKILLVLW